MCVCVSAGEKSSSFIESVCVGKEGWVTDCVGLHVAGLRFGLRECIEVIGFVGGCDIVAGCDTLSWIRVRIFVGRSGLVGFG